MRRVKCLSALLGVSVLMCLQGVASGQSVSQGPSYRYRTVSFTAPGSWSFSVPSDVLAVDLLAGCGGGGAGGAGQASANTAGGAGGTGAICASGIRIAVVPGSSLSGTVGSGGTLSSPGSSGGNGTDTTIAGMADITTLKFPHGNGGAVGASGTGGSSSPSAFSTLGIGGFAGAASGSAAGFAANSTYAAASLMPAPGGGTYYDGMQGGPGGNTATVSQAGGAWKFQNATGGTAGSGNGAGGGGGDSFFSRGQPGTANGVSCSASPTWSGFAGGGGCGAGTNASSGPGQSGGIRLGYWTAGP